MQRLLSVLMGGMLVLVASTALASPASDAADFERLRNAILFPPNTTNVSPDLYVRHGNRKPGDPPLLAHCRQINVQVNGRTQTRRQCITPADNF